MKLDDLELKKDNKTLTFSLDSIDYTYNVLTRDLKKGDSTEKEDKNSWVTYSPDSTYISFAKNHNLYLMEAGDKDSVEIQLTTNGERWFSYQRKHGDTTSDKRLRARASWFKDSKKIIAC